MASSALSFFRKQGEGTEIPKTTRLFYERFKPYYHGGRVSCFEMGLFRDAVNVYDINSAYPFAMVHGHPWGTEYTTWAGILPPPKEIEASFIRLEADSLGVFAVTAKDGTLDFPEDKVKREFCVTGWEYLAARDTRRLRNAKIIESITFAEKKNFREYVDHFYGLKRTLDRKSAEYLYAKLFLNSLYGKFAANPDKYRNYWVVPSNEIGLGEDGLLETPWKFKGGNFEGYIGTENHLALVSMKLEETQQRYYNVATAASITGFVRAMLWRGLYSAERPFYCDTDSIIARNLNADISDELGAWKVEFEGKRIAIAGKKLYAISDGSPWTGFGENNEVPKGWKIASKGSRLTGPEIFNVAGGSIVKWKKEAPSMSLKMGTKFIERNIRRQNV